MWLHFIPGIHLRSTFKYSPKSRQRDSIFLITYTPQLPDLDQLVYMI